MAAGTVFEMAFGKFVEAFETRANSIYGIDGTMKNSGSGNDKPI